MDRLEIRRLALLAAAKVAFSAGLMGCGGVVSDQHKPTNLEANNQGNGGSDSGDQTNNGGSGHSDDRVSTYNPDAQSAVDSTAIGTGYQAGQVNAYPAAIDPTYTTCNAPQNPPFSDDTLTCCKDVLSEAFPPDAVEWPQTLPPDVMTCCEVGVTYLDEVIYGPNSTWDWSQEPVLGYNEVSPCCAPLGYPTGAACTPWGPPAPPVMDWELINGLEVA